MNMTDRSVFVRHSITSGDDHRLSSKKSETYLENDINSIFSRYSCL